MSDVEALIRFERERLQALVQGDLARAGAMHHPAFQLVTPLGHALSRGDYLGAIRDGSLRYLRWDPEEMAGRVAGRAGALRYASTIKVARLGETAPAARYWHTDYFETADDGWQVIFSHATRIG